MIMELRRFCEGSPLGMCDQTTIVTPWSSGMTNAKKSDEAARCGPRRIRPYGVAPSVWDASHLVEVNVFRRRHVVEFTWRRRRFEWSRRPVLCIAVEVGYPVKAR
ncbi:hypothetical protein AU185_04945 [Mycobacterium sp. GA-0227b]|nr:hypothetical protein AU185_04945 [Mycobacterium sp. GA-0227b]